MKQRLSRNLARKSIACWASSLFLVYLGLCLALRGWQTRLIFFPSAELRATPEAVHLAYEEVRLPVAGALLYGWWIGAKQPNAPVVLYLHGTSSNIGDLVQRADRLHRLGISVLLIDYRGYGHSSGRFPCEASVYQDAEVAYRYLRQTRRIPPDRLYVYGQSLGGAIAIELATHHPDLAGVIVESSFTSIRDLVTRLSPVPLLPIDWILTQRFDSLAKVRSLKVPILLIHGTADPVVPVQMSQTLFAAAPPPKTLLLIPGADHDNVAQIGGKRYLQAIQALIDRLHVKVSRQPAPDPPYPTDAQPHPSSLLSFILYPSFFILPPFHLSSHPLYAPLKSRSVPPLSHDRLDSDDASGSDVSGCNARSIGLLGG